MENRQRLMLSTGYTTALLHFTALALNLFYLPHKVDTYPFIVYSSEFQIILFYSYTTTSYILPLFSSP